MRVWKFFKKPKSGEEVPNSVTIEDQYPLYALTNDENLANEFRSIHNMSRFIEKVEKGVTKEEYARLGNTFRSSVISTERLVTWSKDWNKIYIELPLTMLEETVLDEPYIKTINDENFWQEIPIHPGLFVKKYQEALKRIGFIDMYCLINLDVQMESIMISDYGSPDYPVDELNLYIDTFRDILK